ncbi:trypsin-like peptidase domain-containing protein [Streptomyces sp. VNUA74]|uniref:S1C family serine protease n=1 Tax=Streptomyces sp. VNUA74 TaxID=3062685 RepID=UPI00280C3E56|nr:trypsin-like peptidase domain-containing protein [Streptomyces sp. VNUA74]WML82397.1 trypsin-like peptidase domain-containing protein [Streptomyces sp. VNUA74]
MNEAKPTKAKWWTRPRSSEDATDGDFELERPRGADAGSTGDGDFELERPAPPRGTEASDDGDYELDRPAADGAGLPPAPPERPRPLHEPDPYSTPPYGEPGPWAPAPPVQHPATTPAHGTATPSPAPANAPAPHPAPAAPPGAVPDPAFADTPPPTPVPRPAATPPPGATPDPAFADTPPPAPPVGRPGPHLTHGTTASPVPPPGAAPGGAPTPVPPARQPESGDAGAPQPAAAAAAPEPAPGQSAEPDFDPWGRYDPWTASAATAPLQHSGTPDERRRRTRKALIGGALLIALVSGIAGGVVGVHLERNGGVGTVELPQAGAESAKRAPGSVAALAGRALPSVVTLHVSGSESAGTGTGFVLDDRGHILTNNHVVDPAGDGGEITVTFNSGDTAEATVVGRDSGYDLAVVRVKGVSGLTPMPLGNSDNVRVGDPVVAIGAPFDLAGTVTSGIISAMERPITAGGEEGDASDVSYVDALQTDAPINPGNSGGPLLDSRGRAIGINSAIRSAGGGSAESDGGQSGSIGLGFAIPINQGKRVAEELINTGRASHPVIGITLDMDYSGDGARVGADGSAVTKGGPGAEAGIEPGDVITAVDGQRVHSGEELIVKTRAHRPGDRLELTLERDGRERKISLVLGSSDGG